MRYYHYKKYKSLIEEALPLLSTIVFRHWRFDVKVSIVDDLHDIDEIAIDVDTEERHEHEATDLVQAFLDGFILARCPEYKARL